jgi:formylglycine-generating enzyme required for sulfatase activity
VTVGDPVIFTVVATGTAPLSYQWSLNNVSIPGANSDYYAIASAQVANAGNYSVTVSNGTLPTATCVAVALTVNPVALAPSITTPPAGQTVTEGQSATFTVAATGSATLHYRWQENGANVGTDSPTYTLALPLNRNAGDSISVTVSNAAGSVASGPVTLTVNPLVVTIASTMPLNLTPIPAGTFTMGMPASDPVYSSDKGLQHQVTISQNFYMGTFLVTQAQWQAVMGFNPSYFSMAGGGSSTDDLQRPVETVSFTDITTSETVSFTDTISETGFLDRLNQMVLVSPGIPKDYVFRLPTEAEWEYACRAGTTTAFYWGDDPALINSYAWNNKGNSGGPMPVGLFLPNAWGLYDMAGNVSEYCQDLYFSPYLPVPVIDPIDASGIDGIHAEIQDRVIRGGSFYEIGDHCRSAWRGSNAPDRLDYFIGFRVVLAPPRTLIPGSAPNM